MMSTAAPISNEVKDFFKASMSCPVLEGYGQTETCGACTVTHMDDPTNGHVGGPCVQSEIKLIDIPEMDYLTTDVDEEGNPTPRGEICVRGYGIIPGYYKMEEKTKETFDKARWCHTGDVG